VLTVLPFTTISTTTVATVFETRHSARNVPQQPMMVLGAAASAKAAVAAAKEDEDLHGGITGASQ
jgi:hypothetical protein